MGNPTLDQPTEIEAVVKDKDPKEERILFINTSVASIMLSGFLIGFGTAITMVGILQHFEKDFVNNQFFGPLLRNWWYEVNWTFWLIPLSVFILLYIMTGKSFRKHMKKLAEKGN